MKNVVEKEIADIYFEISMAIVRDHVSPFASMENSSMQFLGNFLGFFALSVEFSIFSIYIYTYISWYMRPRVKTQETIASLFNLKKKITRGKRRRIFRYGFSEFSHGFQKYFRFNAGNAFTSLQSGKRVRSVGM